MSGGGGTNPTISAPWKQGEFCFHKDSISGGFWSRENPLNHIFPIMLLQILFIFFISRSIYWLLRPLRQPRFVCNVLAGIILGPSVLGRNKQFNELMFQAKGNYMMYLMSMIGAVYFVFLTAVKMDASMILRTAKTAWSIALSGFVLPFFTVLSLFYALKMKFDGRGQTASSFYAASSLPLTYFIVLVCALDELNLITSELGQLALSLSMIYDAAYLIFWVAAVTLNQTKLVYSVGVLFSTLSFVAFTIFAIRPLILMIIRKTPEGKPVREIYIVSIFTAVAVMAVVSNSIGLPMVHGALLLGLVIPDGPPLGSILIEKAETLVSEVFLQFVFIHVGHEINIYSIQNWKPFFIFQLIIVAAYCTKLLGTLLAALHSKIMLKNAILLSLIMNIKGIVELLVYRKWLQSQFIDTQTFTQLVLSMLGITMIVTPIIEIYYKPQMRLNQHSSDSKKGIRSIQELKNNSEFRVLSCVQGPDNVHSIITLLEGSNHTEASPLSTYVIHLIELVGRAVPLLMQHDTQIRGSKNVNSANSDYIMRAFENFSNNSKGPVTIHPFILLAPYKSMHECICRFAEDNLIPFIIIPFHENQRLVVEHQGVASMRQFNISMQEFAPCTVGILVDRSLSSHLKSKDFSYSVAVIFIGGVDDREALAFAARMSNHSAVSITVLYFIMHGNEKSHYEEERKVDEFLMAEFKLKNRRNPRAAVREIVAHDRIKMIDSLRSIENNYDLLMVGRRRGNKLTIDEEMSGFVENAELGVIGDMLASSDICGGDASVLVMHRAWDADGGRRISSTEHSGSSLMGSEFERR